MSTPGPARLIATCFGCGLLPWAPGSWASLATLPFGWAIDRISGGAGLVGAALLVFAIGWWAAAVVVRGSQEKDPSSIVIDEVAGQLLALAAAPATLLGYGAAFLLFRLFDIWKPWPVSWADRDLPGGLGVMADDMLAGFYAALILTLGRIVLG